MALPKLSTGALNIYADPLLGSATSPTTSPAASSKPEDSDPNYTLNYEEPDKDRKDTAAAITGVKLVGTTGDCTNVVLVFNADQTWQVSGKDSDKCISHDYKYWSISQYDYDSGEIDLVISDKKKDDINTVGDRRVYPISLGEDNTVGIMLVGNDMYSFTITK